MKWLTIALARIFPTYTIAGLRAQQGVKAFYEAAKASQYHKPKTNPGSPDEETRGAVDKLRALARHIEQNYDIGKGVLDVLVNNVVGLGIRPEPQIKGTDGKLHKEVNDQLIALWKDWGKNPEVTQEHRIYGLQRLMARTWLRDGEVLTNLLIGKTRGLDHGTQVPFSLEPLEADYLPTDLDDQNKGIVQGVEKNQWGRARFFHIYKNFPDGMSYAKTNDMKKVPAIRIIHLKMVDRLKQTRGISVFGSVMNRFDDIKEIEESERVAARVAAAMTGVIRKGSPDMYIAPETAGEPRQMEFEPGMVFDNLKPGEDVNTIASNRPNNALIPFRDHNLRAAASGVGASYSSISKNYDGTYSSQRQELAESHVNYGVLWSTFTENWCTPVWERFVSTAIASGKLKIPSDVDRDTLYEVDHSRPAMISVDPAKEMKGIQIELEENLVSKSQVQRRRGHNPDEVRQQIVRERELDEEAGITPPVRKGAPDPNDPDPNVPTPAPSKKDDQSK